MLILGSVGVGILNKDSSWLILVPLTLPGEKVSARITANGPGISTSRLVSLLSSPSANRVEPKCSHFGECNGCNLQHVSYSDQLRQKELSVKSIFNKSKRLFYFLFFILVVHGDVTVFRPILPSPLQYGFRNKLTPHYNKPYYRSENSFCMNFV